MLGRDEIMAVNEAGLTEEEFLKQYNPGDYERPSVTVDMMVLRIKPDFSCLQILLIKRKDHPFINCYALPGGFINMNESAYEAACRELQEETGLTNIYLEQIYTMSKPDRDPRMRIIDIAYAALLPFGYQTNVRAGDDAKDADWFDITFSEDYLKLWNEEKNIQIKYHLETKIFKNGILTIKNKIPEMVIEDSEKLAFDHADIILEELTRLQNKVMYTDIAFNLVPKEFTLPDLQRVYEILLGKPLYKANFRDKIQPKIVSLDKILKPIISMRPSGAYKYKGAEL